MKQLTTIALLFSLFMNAFTAYAQTPGKPLAVGIFVYEGVEVLDFCGPSEVFASTDGFETFIVAFEKKPILSQGFITVVPQYSIDDCPPTDILVFPGGGTGKMVKEPRMIEWIKARDKTTQFMMSVCTGAALLSKAGLLDGMEATTWYGFVDELRRTTPAARVHNDTRFVDNGHIVTTAGVSAGIDGALHVVSRIKGETVAHATAHYMEYDKWQPQEGKVIESAFLTDARQRGLEAALKAHPPVPGSLQPRYYSGELENLAAELLDTRPEESVAIYRHLLSAATPTPGGYDGFGRVLRKMGQTVPPDSRTFKEKLAAGDIAWAKQTWQETQKKHPGWLLCTEEGINSMAYNLLNRKQSKQAIELFRWNTELFPASSNAWDSLAEALEATGDFAQASAASEQCLAKLPASGYGTRQMENLTTVSKERIERLKAKR